MDNRSVSQSLDASAAKAVALAFSVFFLSGMAGLIYQVVWSRLLQLVIGVSIFAITAVICTFMAGLALGSFVFGRIGGRWKDPLLVYGVIEGIIGVYALLTPVIFAGAEPLYAWGFGRFDRFGLNLFRIALSMLILLLPTFLMGGTLPLLARAISVWKARAATGTGLLYAVNTFGAVAGCGLAGFVLLANLGIRGSLVVAAVINLAIAAAVILARRSATEQAVVAPEPPAAAAPRTNEGSFVLALFFLSGFAALGYEVLWTRALLVHLKASTYAFSLMLSVYLLGVATGSAAVSRLAGRVKEPLYGVAACNLGIALTVVAGMLSFPHLRDLGFGIIGSNRISGFGTAVALMASQASIVLLLPTLLMGAMFPFGIAAYHKGRSSVGESVGSLYAVNTFGNIAGSILIGFFGISLLGVRNSMIVLVGLNLLLAAAAVMWATRSRRMMLVWPAAACAVALLANGLVSDRLFYDSITLPGNRILYYREGASDTVAVVEHAKTKHRILVYSDGRGAAGTASLPWNLYFGHLPMLLHSDPQEALHICFGSGNSVMALTRHDPERIDVVEISPHVREAAKYFWTNEGVLDKPNVNLIIEDGRNYVLGTDHTYDVISLEPPNVYSAGVVNLYTQEFYQLAHDRLNPGGIMVQWLPTATFPVADRGRLIRAFTEVFPNVYLFRQLMGPTLLLMGSLEPISVDLDEIDRKLQAESMKSDIKAMNTPDAVSFMSWFLLGDESVRKIAEGWPAVRDDLTVVDYSMPRAVDSGFGFYYYAYPLGEEGFHITQVIQEKLREYASWRDPASLIIPDAEQAARVDAAITRRKGIDVAPASP